MRGRFEYKTLSKYPHLSQTDTRVWERFVTQHPNRFDRADYDVHVGNGIEPSPGWEPEIIFMAMYLTQCRIDVIGYNGNSPTIIEVKGRAMTDAVGQLLTYQALYKLAFVTPVSIPLLLVCEDIHPDISTVCQFHNIEVITV